MAKTYSRLGRVLCALNTWANTEKTVSYALWDRRAKRRQKREALRVLRV